MSSLPGVGVTIWESGTWHGGLQAQPASSLTFWIQTERMGETLDLKDKCREGQNDRLCHLQTVQLIRIPGVLSKLSWSFLAVHRERSPRTIQLGMREALLDRSHWLENLYRDKQGQNSGGYCFYFFWRWKPFQTSEGSDVSLLIHTKRTYVWISPHLSPTCVNTHKHTPTHVYKHIVFIFTLLYLEWWETVIFLNQILFSINIQKCSKRLKGEVFFGCYFTHIDINKSKTILDSSGEAGIAIGTGSWLLSLPVFLFQCCLESAAQRLLKAKSLLLACDSFSLPFILLKCA